MFTKLGRKISSLYSGRSNASKNNKFEAEPGAVQSNSRTMSIKVINTGTPSNKRASVFLNQVKNANESAVVSGETPVSVFGEEEVSPEELQLRRVSSRISRSSHAGWVSGSSMEFEREATLERRNKQTNNKRNSNIMATTSRRARSITTATRKSSLELAGTPTPTFPKSGEDDASKLFRKIKVLGGSATRLDDAQSVGSSEEVGKRSSKKLFKKSVTRAGGPSTVHSESEFTTEDGNDRIVSL